MSDKEFRFSVSVRSAAGDILTVRGDDITEVRDQYTELMNWFSDGRASTAPLQEAQQQQVTPSPSPDEYIPMVQVAKGAKSPPMKCRVCAQRHEFYVNQSSKDGSYFLSVKRGDAWHYPVDGPINWQPA